MSIEDITSSQAKHLSNGARSTAEALIMLLAALENKNSFKDKDNNGIDTILKHVKSGHKTINSTVPINMSRVYEGMLKRYRVPFAKVENKETKEITYIMRDSDKSTLDAIKSIFIDRLDTSYKMMDSVNFLEANEGKDVRVISGFSEAEKELIRYHALNDNVRLIITPSSTDKTKYDVMYAPENEESVKKVLYDAVYDLSGSKGKEVVKQISDNHKIVDEIKNGMAKGMAVVDAKDPGHFLTVTDNFLIAHTLQTKKISGREGDKDIVTDVIQKKPLSDIANIEDYLRDMDAGIMTDNLPYIAGYDTAGKAIIMQDQIKEQYSAFKDLHENDNHYDNIDYGKLRDQDGKIVTMSGIPDDKIAEIYKAVDHDRVVISGNSIAYHDDKTTQKVIDNILYDGTDKLKDYGDKLYYMGRGDIDFKDIKETSYLIAPDNPDYAIKISPAGLSIYQHGQEKGTLSSTSPTYMQDLGTALETITSPVILSEAEIKLPPDEKSKVIRDRMEPETEAKKELERGADKESLYHATDTNYAILPDRQRAAYTEIKLHEIVDHYVDRTLLEKVIDHDLGAKLQQEHVTKTQTRESEPER